MYCVNYFLLTLNPKTLFSITCGLPETNAYHLNQMRKSIDSRVYSPERFGQNQTHHSDIVVINLV